MNHTILALLPAAEQILGLPVYGGHDEIDVTLQCDREDHALQKQLLAEWVDEEGYAGIDELLQATLIDFRQDYPGRIGKPVLRVACMPLYFQEVDPQEWVVHHRDCATRLRIARSVGLLVMGRNEAMAVVLGYESDEQSQMVAAFMTDEHGVPRTLSAVYPQDRRIVGSQRLIADLHKHATDREISDAQADLLYEQSRPKPSSRRMSLLTRTVELLQAHAQVAPDEKKPSGALIHRWFRSGGTGTVGSLVRSEDGWTRYPTGQDAWYYGVWVNFAKRELISYCEGDVAHVVCENDDQMRAELHEMALFYGRDDRKPCAIGYGDGEVTHFYDTLFRKPNKEVAMRLQIGSSAGVPVFASLDMSHRFWCDLSDDVEATVPEAAFEIDLLNPLAFEPHTLRVMQVDNTLAIIFEVPGQPPRFAQIDKPTSSTLES